MNEPNSSSKPIPGKNRKWIALASILALALSGGIYQLSKRRGSQPGAQVPPAAHESSESTESRESQGPSEVAVAPTRAGNQGRTTAKEALAGKPQLAMGTSPTAPTAAKDQCVTITYRHKVLPTHNDEESCSHHKNLLKLKDSQFVASSVCVRVNGTPVHYLTVKGHPDELIFGSVAGPKSKVTARYCTGKGQGCVKEDCSVPKDEFMEAIGGGEGGTQNAKLGQWDPDAPAEKEADVMAKLDGEVKRELETNDDLNGRAPAGEMFKDWIGEAQSAACGSAQASN